MPNEIQSSNVKYIRLFCALLFDIQLTFELWPLTFSFHSLFPFTAAKPFGEMDSPGAADSDLVYAAVAVAQVYGSQAGTDALVVKPNPVFRESNRVAAAVISPAERDAAAVIGGQGIGGFIVGRRIPLVVDSVTVPDRVDLDGNPRFCFYRQGPGQPDSGGKVPGGPLEPVLGQGPDNVGRACGGNNADNADDNHEFD